MKIENLVIVKDKDKKASDKLYELFIKKRKEILEKEINLPFEATGTFEKQPLGLDGKPIIVKPVDFGEKTVTKDKGKNIYTKKELEKMEFNDLRKIGDELKVKGRSLRGLIKDILGAQ